MSPEVDPFGLAARADRIEELTREWRAGWTVLMHAPGLPAFSAPALVERVLSGVLGFDQQAEQYYLEQVKAGQPYENPYGPERVQQVAELHEELCPAVAAGFPRSNSELRRREIQFVWSLRLLEVHRDYAVRGARFDAEVAHIKAESTADSKTDSRKKSPARVPENPRVVKLAKKIKRERATGSTMIDIARDFTDGNEAEAQQLLRQVRRFPHLLD